MLRWSTTWWSYYMNSISLFLLITRPLLSLFFFKCRSMPGQPMVFHMGARVPKYFYREKTTMSLLPSTYQRTKFQTHHCPIRRNGCCLCQKLTILYYSSSTGKIYGRPRRIRRMLLWYDIQCPY